MTRAAGRLLVAIAALHFAVGAWLGRAPLREIARAGFFGALASNSNRQLWFWFLAFTPPLAILGVLLARGEARPRSGWAGATLAAIAGVGAALLPVSGFWLLFLPAGLLVADARRRPAAPRQWRRGEFTISTDPSRLDRAAIANFLTTSYWAAGIPRSVADRAIDGSLSFGLFEGARQIGFARVVTDRATFAYLADVYVLEEYRGRGLALWMMETIRAHPELQKLRRWMLATRDAHPLYRKVGYVSLAQPERLMEIVDPDIYRRGSPPFAR
jgi:GNAT superfamily N-acetyltransferase